MVTFDDVLSTLVRTCEEAPGFGAVKRACCVRDLEGRVRLLLEADEAIDLPALEERLDSALGRWFAAPILGAGALARPPREPTRLASTLSSLEEPWPEAGWTDQATGTRRTAPAGRWRKVERRLSKRAWLARTSAQPPWPLTSNVPAIVTFFSFKGGVGRTTLLAATAWQLAAKGKRVVCVDLDLEAPGLGTLLGAESRRGVIDLLVDHLALGQADLTDALAPASGLGDEASQVDVVPAGRLDEGYFEKLGRLDFVGSGLLEESAESPIQRALSALLFKLRARRPDYILLDSRAGLHDLAGLSLHDLAHVDVLLARDSQQGYDGLELTVAALGERHLARQLRCVVVQALAPTDQGSPEYERSTAEFRHRSWDAFARHLYPKAEAAGTEAAPGDLRELEEESAPAEGSETAAHSPRVVRYDERLVRFSSLSAIREQLFSEDVRRLVGRIEELTAPEGEDEGDEEASA